MHLQLIKSSNMKNSIQSCLHMGVIAAAMIVTHAPAADLTGDRLNVGQGHTLSGSWATIAGGETNKATTNYAVVSGGFSNSAVAVKSVVSGGSENVVSGTNSTIAGGNRNRVEGPFSVISGGERNKILTTNGLPS